MDILFGDYETYFEHKGYTLRAMSPAEYILDPRFEALGCGFKWAMSPAPFWVDGPDLPAFFATVDWANTYFVSHNALFDACIMKWRYNVNPARLGDTLAMAQNWISYDTLGVSLSKCCAYYGLGVKMDTTHKTAGKHLADIRADPPLYRELVIYGCDDTTKCEALFNRMISDGFPQGQLPVIDRLIRMATMPQYVVDPDVMHAHLGAVRAEKDDLLVRAGLTSNEGLMSNELFHWLLFSRGVEPPRKVSAKTGKETHAFAKSDKEFMALLEHDDPVVQALVAARLGHKTTLEETRTQRFINIGNLEWPAWERPQSLPVPLFYSGAHTHRFSGSWSMNLQNLGRKSPMRAGLKAPKGKVVVSADASQIEARVVAALGRWLAMQNHEPHSDLIEQFEAKLDVYSIFAEDIFMIPVNKRDNPTERFVGKTGILSLGYGSSWVVFQNMCRVQSGGSVLLPDPIAVGIVTTYRTKHREIKKLWKYADKLIPFIATAAPGEWKQFGPVIAMREVIILPNGNRLHYKNLRMLVNVETGGSDWWYDHGRETRKLYGAKVIENITQALAFLLIMEADLRIAEWSNHELTLAHQIHDELIYVVPAEMGSAVLEKAKMEISRRPTWLPWLPLGADGGIGDSYATAKPA